MDLLLDDIIDIAEWIDRFKFNKGAMEDLHEFALRRLKNKYSDDDIMSGYVYYNQHMSPEAIRLRNLDTAKKLIEQKADLIQQKKRRQVKGRRKPKQGTKRLQTKYESSRTFEYETIRFWQNEIKWLKSTNGVAFRRPVSQSPADVWCITSNSKSLTQCKTTLDMTMPKKDPEEEAKFIKYCKDLNAFCFWASRYKKNKNVYVRVLEIYNFGEERWDIYVPDFSDRIS